MRFSNSLLAVAVASTLLSACGSDSPEPDITAQAIDGYIVGADVFCDGVAHGKTGAAGRLSCPPDTQMITVRGGADVGFDENATTGDILFVGELSAPADLGFVTPLSTLAVEMSTDEEGFDPSRWTQSVNDLASTLSQSSLDLSADASEVIQLIKLNAQVNQLISAYASTESEFRLVTKEVAGLMQQRARLGAVTDLQDGLANTMASLNGRLLVKAPGLAQSQSKLDVNVIAVQSTNKAIAEGGSPELVAMAAVGSIVERAAVTIDREVSSLQFYYRSGVFSGEFGNQGYTPISVDDFENPVTSAGSYTTVVDEYINGIAYNNRALQFNQSFDNAKVSMAFEIKALDAGDKRSLSFSTSDVFLTADMNDASSLVLSLPSDAKFRAHGVNSDGSTTTTEILVDEAATFSSQSGLIDVSFGEVNGKLKAIGFRDIFESSGNFQVTLVISGLHFNERTGSSIVPAQYYTIGNGATRITGAGFQGFITLNLD